MYSCQNWQCSAGHSPEPTAKKHKKTTYNKMTNDGVQVENLDPTGLRKILLYTTYHMCIDTQKKSTSTSTRRRVLVVLVLVLVPGYTEVRRTNIGACVLGPHPLTIITRHYCEIHNLQCK